CQVYDSSGKMLF
nr:immunoglobulin light chain junction region [Macaca mulatta]MPN85176.1 immunoglobulin light chain junction region [Macaca mulatta]MPN85186.1 immunoglobulin light chain junction region [Macaca mulatta]MPN85193.1 immunoglobulin light chain junction region [Macaca mulatta]MPN85196.1 immunoglobulin light chain junction region [Macaca mulatta]